MSSSGTKETNCKSFEYLILSQCSIHVFLYLNYFFLEQKKRTQQFNSFLHGHFYLGDREQQQDLINLLGATYAAVLFLGATNATSVQSVVSIERTVFYRERAAGMYSELPYAFAQVRHEIK